MKKSKKKLVGLTLAACALSLTGAMLCISSPKTVSAATSYGLTMSKGAAVRLETDDDSIPVNGLRFDAQMTKAGYNALQGSEGSEIVLSSTATANKVSKTVEWVLKSTTKEAEEPLFDSKDVAKFYHTLTFESLSEEKLKQANAFDFEVSFTLEVDGETVWESETETRSMRQVAYIEYTTEGMEGYQEEALLNYFSEGEDNETVYSVGEADENTVSAVVATTAYAEIDGMFVDVSSTAMKDLYAENATHVVVFDENNVASKTPIKWPDAMISTAAEMSALLTDGTTQAGKYYVLKNNIYIPELTAMAAANTYTPSITFNGILDGNGYALYAPQRMFGLFGNIGTGAVVKNMKIVVDVSSVENLQGSLNQNVVLGVKILGTLDNLYIKMIGDATKIEMYGFMLFNYATTDSSAFKNLVLDYADMLPVSPTAQGNEKYNSLLGASDIPELLTNIHTISTTCDWLRPTEKATVGSAGYEEVSLHSDMTTIPVEDLSEQYWDKTGAVPVWKKDKVVDNNQVLWSANTKIGHLVEGLLPEGESVQSVKDFVSGTVYYENGGWKNTDLLPQDKGETAPVIFYKAVEVVGSNDTIVKTFMNVYNRVITEADHMQFLASAGSTVAGKYIMVDNVTVTEWSDDSATTMSAITFDGVFDGNGYTLSTPQRLYGLFGTVNENAVIKNIRMNVTARGSKINDIVVSPVSSGTGGVLAFKVNGAFENIYVQVSGTASTQGIGLVGLLNQSASLKNVVVDYGTTYNTGITSPQYYKGYLTCASQLPEDGVILVNVYAIGENKTKYLHERGTSTYNPRVVAENEYDATVTTPIAESKLSGVRRYNNVAAVVADTTEGKDLTGFDSTYWDTTSGAPVWKDK
ncbi:MAG: hypothetical protein IJ506_01790 [Clostridia bacterium]|nr:hypothetical protein [Clostridia bacterium]